MLVVYNLISLYLIVKIAPVGGRWQGLGVSWVQHANLQVEFNTKNIKTSPVSEPWGVQMARSKAE